MNSPSPLQSSGLPFVFRNFRGQGVLGNVAGIQNGEVASINLPALSDVDSPKGVKIVRQCIQPWVDTYEERRDPRGGRPRDPRAAA